MSLSVQRVEEERKRKRGRKKRDKEHKKVKMKMKEKQKKRERLKIYRVLKIGFKVKKGWDTKRKVRSVLLDGRNQSEWRTIHIQSRQITLHTVTYTLPTCFALVF